MEKKEGGCVKCCWEFEFWTLVLEKEILLSFV